MRNLKNNQVQARSIKTISIMILVSLSAVFLYYMLNALDKRNVGQKVGDAITELPNGLEKASRQLENRTPADKISDSIKDTNEDIKKTTNQQ